MNIFDVCVLIRVRVRRLYINGVLFIATAFGLTSCGGGGGGGSGNDSARVVANEPTSDTMSGAPLMNESTELGESGESGEFIFTSADFYPNLFRAKDDSFTNFGAGHRSGNSDIIDASDLTTAITVNLDDAEQGGVKVNSVIVGDMVGDTNLIADFEGYYGGSGAEIIYLSSDSVSYVKAGGGDDTINILPDTKVPQTHVAGGAGADTFNIAGGNGHTLTGGAGNDTFNIAGGERHTLSGGDGADTFSFTVSSDGTTIMDFTTGEDKLDFADLTGATYAIAANGAITIHHGAADARVMFAIMAVGAAGSDITGADLELADEALSGAGAGAGTSSATNPNLIPVTDDKFTTFAAGSVSGKFDVIDASELTATIEVNLNDAPLLEEGINANSVISDSKVGSIAYFEGYYGGSGPETIYLDRDSVNYIDAGGGTDVIHILKYTTVSHTDVDGGDGNDIFYIEGGNKHELTGGADDDTFHIEGGTGHKLSGGVGADTFNIMAGGGHTLDGGSGADTFSFTVSSDGTKITNFDSGDKLDFSGLTDATYELGDNGEITICHSKGMFSITAVGAAGGDIMGATLLDVERVIRRAVADGVVSFAETDGNLIINFSNIDFANGDMITFDKQAGAYNADTDSREGISLDEFVGAISNGNIRLDEFFETIFANFFVDSGLILDFRHALADKDVTITEMNDNLVLSDNRDTITYDKQAGAFNADTDSNGDISFDEFTTAIGMAYLDFESFFLW